MKNLLLIVLVAISIFSLDSSAKVKPIKGRLAAKIDRIEPPKLDYGHPKPYFFNFYCNKTPPVRDKFETNEEYLRRCPPQVDTNKLHLFIIDVKQGFDYYIDNYLLTIYAGDVPWEKIPKFNPAGTNILEIGADFEKENYEASNSFGATVNVEKRTAWLLWLYYINGELPNTIFNRSMNRVEFSIKREPAEAKRLSKDAIIVIGVKFVDKDKCDATMLSKTDATFTDPTETERYAVGIVGKICKFWLFDTVKNEILAEYNLENYPKP